MASIPHSAAALTTSTASDLFRSSSNGVSGLSLKTLGRARFAAPRRDLTVTVIARLRKGKKHERPWPKDPDPNVKGGVLIHLSHFKPSKQKPKPVTLEFEKPLLDLEKKIIDVRKMADQTGLDFSDQITSLEEKYHEALKVLYTHLTPIQRVNIARHPNRPTFLDHVFNITEKFVELHGDRCGYDDPAIVTGIGTIDGQRYMFIGHQKGRNTKENIKRNFGMPTPHGYRKALRMMYYADHHGFPIVTFIDTPGAYADLKSEELGQGEAIAHNLRSMFGLKVPVISIVIGEGGSGGALAIGCANKLLMLENAVFYVASPEACAAILWKTAKASPKAAKKLKITARQLYKLQIADGIIREPLGGAHTDPEWTSQKLKAAINKAMKELTKMDTEKLLKHRMQKFRKIGGFQEGIPIETSKKFMMKKREAPAIERISNEHLEGEVEMLKKQILKAMESSSKPPEVALRSLIGKLKKEVDHEYDEAYKALGLKDRLDSVRAELLKINANQQPLTPELVDEIKDLEDEFHQSLQEAPNCSKLQFKLRMFNELLSARSLSDAATLKVEVNKKFKEVLEQPAVMEKVRALKAEIQNSGASNFEELNQELKEKVGKVKKEVEGEVINVLQSMGFDVEAIKSNMKVLSEQGPFTAFKDKMDILNEELEKKIGDIMKASELKDMIQVLKLETAKAEKAPDAVAKSKIEVLETQIKERISEALMSSKLKSEHEKLIGEISKTIESSGGSNGSLNGSMYEDPREAHPISSEKH